MPSVISRKYLNFICNRILALWDSYVSSRITSNKDIQQFVILHRCVQNLHFDIHGKSKVHVMNYLMELCMRMQRTTRTILREQICQSLMAIFESTSPLAEIEPEREEANEDGLLAADIVATNVADKHNERDYFQTLQSTIHFTFIYYKTSTHNSEHDNEDEKVNEKSKDARKNNNATNGKNAV
ncbi:hypothetical protein RFI_22599, partial [Reticulomyxa filosa]